MYQGMHRYRILVYLEKTVEPSGMIQWDCIRSWCVKEQHPHS